MDRVLPSLSELPGYLVYLLLNPTFNLTAALLLYAAIVVLLLLVMVVGIMVLGKDRSRRGTRGVQPPDGSSTHSSDEVAEGLDQRDPGKDLEGFDQLSPGEVFDGLERAEEPSDSADGRPARLAGRINGVRSRRTSGVVVALVVVAAWTAAGYTTSQPSLCKECHWPAAQHAAAVEGSDPHVGLDCVSCHEPGGWIGRYLTRVPARLLHFADANEREPQHEYGFVTSSACMVCHDERLDQVVLDETRGLKMLHRGALAASAACTDCHRLRAGVVGTHSSGMAPCLRCHDSVVRSAECDVCHDAPTSAAARVRTASLSHQQIADVSCGGCHDEVRECDPCHGVRMPHSTEFKLYAHARAGAANFWFQSGSACSACHTETRRSCQRCHSELLGKAHGEGRSWLADGHKSAQVDACDTCHKQFAYTTSRDFCLELCHTPAAVEGSPR